MTIDQRVQKDLTELYNGSATLGDVTILDGEIW